ncbi:MAG: glycosyltransferase family 4 protein [Thermoplasmatota archaeon]
MRIVHLNPFFYPYFGGIERRMHHLARGLAARGHEVTILTARLPGTAERQEMEGFHVRRLPARVLLAGWNPPIVRTRGTREALAELAPDVVDYHSRWAPEMTNAVARAGDAGQRWVFTFHNHFGEGSRWLKGLSLANDVWSRTRILRANRVVCVSEAIRRELLGRRFPGDRLTVVGNGCDPPLPGGADWQPDDGRPAPAAPYFVTVGRLTPEKGVMEALEAFLEGGLAGRAHLAICGTGPLAGRLRRRITSAGADDSVSLQGWVPEATKFRLLSGAAALVNLAPFEAYGIAAAEAVVAGIPVLFADVGGVADVVGGGGIGVPAGAVGEAAGALVRLVDDGAWRARLAEGARARAPALSWDHSVAAMEATYRDVLAG